RGCRRICRGEGWLRPARCCSIGSGRPDLDLLISGPRVSLLHQLHARARALLARPWSARCYGVARPREGSRQNSSGLRRAFTPAFFGLVLFILWRVGAEESLWFRPARCCSTGLGRLDLDLLISGP